MLTAPLLVALASHLLADSSWVSFCVTELQLELRVCTTKGMLFEEIIENYSNKLKWGTQPR